MSESLTWVKSSYSSTGNCVEVAGQAGRVLIRDTKDQSGPILSIGAAVWRRFTGEVKRSLAARPGPRCPTCSGDRPAGTPLCENFRHISRRPYKAARAAASARSPLLTLPLPHRPGPRRSASTKSESSWVAVKPEKVPGPRRDWIRKPSR
jgi:Domain of unknown function (DUF397)